MKSEVEIRERLKQVEAQLENSSGHDQSHLVGQRNILEWVLDDDEGGQRNRSSVRTRGQHR